MDILSFEIERIFEESEDNVDSDYNLADQNIDVHWPAAAGEGPIISVTGPAPFEDMKLISSPQSQDLTPYSTVTHQNKVDPISESDKNDGKGPIISIIKPISSPQSQDLRPSSTVTHQNKVDNISESDKSDEKYSNEFFGCGSWKDI